VLAVFFSLTRQHAADSGSNTGNTRDAVSAMGNTAPD
jgi:hypothetical protein